MLLGSIARTQPHIQQLNMTEEARKPGKRWRQFTVRGLLVLVFIFSLPLAWLGHRLQKARNQRSSIVKLEAMGAVYLYDWQPEVYAGSSLDGPQPPQPNWLINLVGRDFLWDVTKIGLRPNPLKSEIVDEELAILGEFPKTEALSLYSCQIGDEGVLHLANLRNLRTLQLAKTGITDRGLEVLGDVACLKELDLAGTSITGRGFAHLSRIDSLTHLDLHGSDVNDEGMEYITDLSHLESLNLGNTRISDKGLECLKDQEHLTVLRIDRCTGVTDAGLSHLTEIAELQELDLSSTPITDHGLRHISQLGSLRRLNLSGTPITDDGLVCLFGLDLWEIDLRGTNVTSEGMDRAQRAINCVVLPRVVFGGEREPPMGIHEVPREGDLILE